MNSKSPKLVINGYPLSIRHKGIGAYTLRLIAGLLEYASDLSFRVLLPEEFREHVQDLPSDTFTFVKGHPPLSRPLMQNIYWHHRLAGVSKKLFPDAVYHSPAETWSMHRPQRTIVTLHDCIYRHFPRLMGGRVRKWWWKATERYARCADLVLTDSEASRDDLIHYCGIEPQRCRVVYPWINANFSPAKGQHAAEAVRRKYRLPARFFLYVGGYNVNKNVEFLIGGYARGCQLNRSLPPLVLAGGIPTNLDLAVCDVHGATQRTGLGSKEVITPGFIEEDDLPGLYAAASLFVFPSSYEGFGYTPAEAIAVGTPTLVADATSLKEVIPWAENRFPLDDPSVLANLLVAAAEDPDRFRRELPSSFRPVYGIRAYLDALHGVFPELLK
jgi:glycosyltransferase involved in cell wall biosynthesis